MCIKIFSHRIQNFYMAVDLLLYCYSFIFIWNEEILCNFYVCMYVWAEESLYYFAAEKIIKIINKLTEIASIYLCGAKCCRLSDLLSIFHAI